MVVSENLRNNSLSFFSFKEKIETTEDALEVGRLLIEGRRSFSFLFGAFLFLHYVIIFIFIFFLFFFLESYIAFIYLFIYLFFNVQSL